jgi:hypothetical protein
MPDARYFFSPHLCVGFLFVVAHSRPHFRRNPLSHATTLSHTQLTHTHNPLTHNSRTHTQPSHNSLTHNLLAHNFLTHNSLTHNNPLTTSSQQLSHTQLTHPHNSLTHNYSLTNNLLTHNLITHNSLTLNNPLTTLGTYGTGLPLVARLVPVGAAALCVAGVALGDTHLRFAVAWQLWHLLTCMSYFCACLVETVWKRCFRVFGHILRAHSVWL